MTDLNYKRRKWLIIGLIHFVGIIFLVKLFFLQVLDHDYKLFAQNNVLRYITQYPARGLIYDRSGELLVYNEAAYDLLVVPNQVQSIDTSKFCKLLNIPKEEYKKRFERAKKHSPYKSSIFLEQLSKEEYGFVEEQLYKFPGFYIQSRTLRKYPKPIAAHILGFVGEVDKKEIAGDSYYKQGDYIGKSGIEKSYESLLRGDKGMKVVMVDVFNREMGSYQEGKFDTTAHAGKNLFLTIDANLQAYGEKLMHNKKGSIVAIEPSTGEVLAMVSSPSYDPNLLIGRVRTKNFRKLSKDTLEPLYNRPTQAQYPPGSTFKLANALIGLQEKVLYPGTKYGCDGVVSVPIKCSHNHYAPLELPGAIEQSCNPYFWRVFRSIIEQPKFDSIQQGYILWKNYLGSLNIGKGFNSDIGNQRSGNLPEASYFNRYYGRSGWRAITIRSFAIGQGEVELTPLQLANLTAILANRGFYITPHLVKAVDEQSNEFKRYAEKHQTAIDSINFTTVIEGMRQVYEGTHGSARWYKPDSISIAGKTGTSENPHGQDHSVFIAFAPVDNPKIAVATVVETSGFGSTWAAPISTLMVEKYLKGEVKKSWFEEKMINANLLNGSEKKD
ncbi:MAG: penicillin-binding protein 2 [Bacteroidales bacterium]|nr:penicillin-binding protein 2 [Bacteroidales bacterium]MCF8343722.1 penicillin-binding protein 2 [Bacteroidales bacterium]MCF8376195.1 penicillin-binding protein 2 [Bacteroidales bacterium]MCF8401139.1 penicillin-binding protein 2 [Bacteroidales bacterium]